MDRLVNTQMTKKPRMLLIYFIVVELLTTSLSMIVKEIEKEITKEVADNYHRLFLDKDEYFIMYKKVAEALEWSLQKRSKNIAKAEEYPWKRPRLHEQDQRLQSRHGYLETLLKLAKDDSELLERTSWSFRLSFPSKEAAIIDFESRLSVELEIFLCNTTLGLSPSGQKIRLDQEELNKMLMNLMGKRIAKFKERVQFIEDYPQLFVIPQADRYAVQGVRFSMNRAVCYDNPITKERVEIAEPGKGAVVTVVDRNDLLSPNEPIHLYLKAKMTNPNENCHASVSSSGPIKFAHATFVASIIAVDTKQHHIGLARSTRIQLMPCWTARAKSYTNQRKEVILEEEPVYDEQYYKGLLDAFGRGKKVFYDSKRIIYLCMAQTRTNDQPDFRDLPLEECLPSVDGHIINFSIGFQALNRFLPKNEEEGRLEQYYFWWYELYIKRKLLVMAAGNESLNAGSGFMFRFMKVFASHPSTCENFIMVTNLDIDGLHPHFSSVLPGKHRGLQSRTISAIGTGIEGLKNWPQEAAFTVKQTGTSFSAPFISATAATIEGQFPKLSMAQISRCILDSATPIILVGSNPYFLKPVALDIMSYELNEPGIYLDAEGQPREVTREMIEMSRETYGHGRVHVERALQLASLMSRDIQSKDVPAA